MDRAQIEAIRKAEKGLGWYQKNMLSFLRKYPDWHTVSEDTNMQRVKESLIKRGLIISHPCGQYNTVKAVSGWVRYWE